VINMPYNVDNADTEKCQITGMDVGAYVSAMHWEATSVLKV